MEPDRIHSSLSANASPTSFQPPTQPPVGPIFSVALSLAVLLSFTAVCHLVHQDYKDFKSLGPGGTPSTVLGYLRIKFLGLFALSNPYMPPPIPSDIYLNRPCYLSKGEIPNRKGPRPIVCGIAPHRQMNQHSTLDAFQLLRDNIVRVGNAWPRKLRHGTSCLEKYGPGLFALQPINRSQHCSSEVCHAHPSDGSMHLTLHPADAAVVVLRGWGERHPLSSGGWLARFVPHGFVMVYAPRTEEEVQLVIKIVAAATWWVSGVDVEGKFGPQELEEVEDQGAMIDAWQQQPCQLTGFAKKMAD